MRCFLGGADKAPEGHSILIRIILLQNSYQRVKFWAASLQMITASACDDADPAIERHLFSVRQPGLLQESCIFAGNRRRCGCPLHWLYGCRLCHEVPNRPNNSLGVISPRGHGFPPDKREDFVQQRLHLRVFGFSLDGRSFIRSPYTVARFLGGKTHQPVPIRAKKTAS